MARPLLVGLSLAVVCINVSCSGSAACTRGTCDGVPSLASNPYCEPETCQRLEELTQGCIGSHTERECIACGETWVEVGGDDAHTLFYATDGTLAAVQVTDQSDDACGGWYGLDLSSCEPQEETRTVPCDPQSSE